MVAAMLSGLTRMVDAQALASPAPASAWRRRFEAVGAETLIRYALGPSWLGSWSRWGRAVAPKPPGGGGLQKTVVLACAILEGD